MKALIKFAVVPFVAAGSLMGCLNADSVSSRDVAYNEIHVDAFTHTLTYERLNALEIRGDSIFSDDGVSVLLDSSFDKSATQPAFILDTNAASEIQAYYKTKYEPANFSCILKRTGYLNWIEGSLDDTLGVDTVKVYGEWFPDETDSVWVTTAFSFTPVEEWRPTICSYIPGKGFYFPAWIGEQDLGTIVIRY